MQLTSFATSVKVVAALYLIRCSPRLCPSVLTILDQVLMLQWLDKSESYFGDESSKLSIFDHTIELQQVTKAKENVTL